MAGTRDDVFAQVDEWANDLRARNILWIKGSLGAGKSTVAFTLKSRFRTAKRIVSYFFIKETLTHSGAG